MQAAEQERSVFRAIADPTRRAILDRLRRGPAPVNELASEFSQSRPAISKHLRILREARVVSEERSGRERLYRLEPEQLREIADWILPYRAFWQVSLGNLKTYLESEK
ncbi:metalloregulator ArsR/SmtB family transcription factor [Mesorhizobium sp. BAC0120]|uniref:ArsR/SmtB family transcription factor n=1 Tax=Mesorhizobium sp. BAC0120 TaxID=3090670 RepID=UPI00298CC02E|nr:metalloregulator ArsR/SmtB family transcription factor [Mesorhizobium sp. BAC0120]MDW6024074.1 metalloregulator ArsR/SmtB family transcription factor [Mesorhizobium sp. BAC0120]